jgi:hypothetical protein
MSEHNVGREMGIEGDMKMQGIRNKLKACKVIFFSLETKKKKNKKKTKLRGLSPQANYTDRATAAVGEVVPTFAGRGVLRGQCNGSPRPLISVF